MRGSSARYSYQAVAIVEHQIIEFNFAFIIRVVRDEI
jgi:hypothetical protein